MVLADNSFVQMEGTCTAETRIGQFCEELEMAFLVMSLGSGYYIVLGSSYLRKRRVIMICKATASNSQKGKACTLF